MFIDRHPYPETLLVADVDRDGASELVVGYHQHIGDQIVGYHGIITACDDDTWGD